MASARPSKAYRGGGGFLNNVDGTIKDYVFTDKAPNSNESGEWLYLKLSVLVDGAEAPVSTHLFAGAAERFLPLADKGRTLGGDNALGANTPAIKFLESMTANGFDENELPDDKVNYEAIIGRRARFVQQVDEEANKKIGKRKVGDKEYNRTQLTVSAVYPATTGKTVTKAATKPNGKAIEQSVEEVAAETLLAILNENDGSILKSKLPTKVAVKLGPKHPMRDEVRRTIFSDEFLNSEQGWGYDSKSQTIVSA
jgi:hypothetical protein